MDQDTIETLRERHPAWRLLRAGHAPLILAFLGRHFVEANHGATPASRLIEALDDHLYAVNSAADEPRFPRPAGEYLENWAATESGWLRRFYPADSDEVHYDATPAFQKAYAFTAGLRARPFIGTESRLHSVVELLRQIVHGSDADPDARLARLHEQRAEIDRAIAEVEGGNVTVLTDTEVRDRYQLLSATARDLLTDFREVEENFRGLDRAAREKIATWAGGKGELLVELVSGRADINASDQGRSFQAFYDFLLSEQRQDELSDLLARVQRLAPAEADGRLRTVHHDWAEAAERTQQTVRQISEQLRRFLDDQVWLENRRVLDLVRAIEGAALACRADPPEAGVAIDLPGVGITLPFERPLYSERAGADVQSMLDPVADTALDVSALLDQTFVDAARLAANIRAVLPPRGTTLLRDILELYPVEQGVAEIIGYLALNEDDLAVNLDDTEEMTLEYLDTTGQPRLARLPRVTVTRR